MKIDRHEAKQRAIDLYNAGLYARYTWGQGKAVRGTNHAALADCPPTYDEITRVDYSGGLAILNGTPHPAGGFTLNTDVDNGPQEWEITAPHPDCLLVEEGTAPGKWHISWRTKDQMVGQIDLRFADDIRGKAVAELKGKGITALRSYPTMPPGKPRGYTPRYLTSTVQGEPEWTVQQLVDMLCAYFTRVHGRRVVSVAQTIDSTGKGRGPLPDELSATIERALQLRGAQLRNPRPNGWQQGYCPFHDDREASLSINFLRGSWKCFAGCGAGSLWSIADRLGIAIPAATRTDRANPSESRTYIRDSEGFSGQAHHGQENAPEDGNEAVPALPSLSDIATERAGQWTEMARSFLPITEDMEIHGSSSMFRMKDNGRRMATHAGLSDTWSVTGNAQCKRQRFLAFYIAGFHWLIKEQEQPVYLYKHKLHPDAVEQDKANLRQMQQRISGKKGDYLKVTCLYPDEEGGGCWLHFYTNVQDRKLGDEMAVATAADLVDSFKHAAKLPDFYELRHPVRASDNWRMRRARTGEWELVGTRAVYDLRGYEDTIDKPDVEKAEKWGIKTWKASDAEVMARAPDRIMHTRHFEAPENISDEEMLIWSQGLGFQLLPHALDEVDNLLDPKAIERRATARIMRKQERQERRSHASGS